MSNSRYNTEFVDAYFVLTIKERMPADKKNNESPILLKNSIIVKVSAEFYPHLFTSKEVAEIIKERFGIIHKNIQTIDDDKFKNLLSNELKEYNINLIDISVLYDVYQKIAGGKEPETHFAKGFEPKNYFEEVKLAYYLLFQKYDYKKKH